LVSRTRSNFEFLVDTRPLPDFDDKRLSDGELAERAHVGPDAVRQHIGTAAVVLGPCGHEPVTETIKLLGVDRIDVESALE
jgi:hypothetical protein